MDLPAITPVDQRAIPRKKDVWHLITMGVLTEATYDTESTDLNKNFAWITEFGGVISDLAGNVLHATHVFSRVPEHTGISPEAALVTRRRPDDLYQNGEDPHIAAGKIAQFFKDSADLSARSTVSAALLEGLRTDTVVKPDGKTETVYLYPLMEEDGSLDYVRIHENGAWISYKNDRGDWVKVASAVMTNGYNQAKADDRWIWAMLFMTGHDDVFVTHVKKHRKFRCDLLGAARMYALFGPQGEEGMKTGTRYDERQGRTVPSFKLSDVMQANTRRPVPERNIGPGVLLPDGSEYDDLNAHGSLADAWTTLGLKQYLRRVAPDLMRQIETHAHLPNLKQFLMSSGDGFGSRRLLAFGRGTHLDLTSHVGVCINIDESYGDFKQAVLINLVDYDPATYRFNGKALFDLDVDDIKILMQQQRGQQKALFEVIHERRTPNVVDLDRGYNANAHKGIDRDELERRRRLILGHDGFCDRVMQAYETTLPRDKPAAELVNPQPEEEIFTFMGDLKRVEQEIDGRTIRLDESFHARAADRLNNARRITYWLKRVTKPDPIEWLDTSLDTPERQIQVLTDFIRKIKEGQAKLDFYTTRSPVTLPPLPIPEPDELKAMGDLTLDDYIAQAVDAGLDNEGSLYHELHDYLWEVRRAVLYEFMDYTMKYDVIDAKGHRIPFVDLLTMPPVERNARLKQGEFEFVFEELDTSTQILATLFMSSGRGDQLGEAATDFYKSLCALRSYGEPDVDPTDHRWMSTRRALVHLDRIEQNLQRRGAVRAWEDETGWWDIFVARPHHEQQAIIADLRRFYEERLAAYPMTRDAMRLMGYDPQTARAFENVEYTVDPATAVTWVLPDRHIANPLKHSQVATRFLLAPVQTLPDGADLLLTCAESGKTYLAANAQAIDAPPKGAAFQDIYRQARNDYADSGMTLPEKPAELMAVAVENIVPVHGLATPDLNLQTVKTASVFEFESLLSPLLALRDQVPTGLLLQDYGWEPKVGPARLLEGGADGKETGWEARANIKQVRRMNLLELETMTDKDADLYGFPSRAEMIKHVRNWFVNRKIDVTGQEDKHSFWAIRFDKIKKKSVLYYAPWQIPTAAVRRDAANDDTPAPVPGRTAKAAGMRPQDSL